MDGLEIEDVRCFRGSVKIPIKPLTLLVGENSTGKSTVLAMIRAAWDLAFGAPLPNFNEEPFVLGAYEQIAHYHGGQGKRSKSFRIAYDGSSQVGADKRNVRMQGTYEAEAGQPRLARWSVSNDSIEITLNIGRKSDDTTISITTDKQSIEGQIAKHPFADLRNNLPGLPISLGLFLFHLDPARQKGEANTLLGQKVSESLLNSIKDLAQLAQRRPLSRPYAVAPIRSKPFRTYDPVKNAPTPEGSHVPGALARLYSRTSTESETHHSALHEFGKNAALFDKINVRHLGAKKQSDPFQIQLRMPNQTGETNLVDVGYGVSQVLPILVDTIEPQSDIILLQQPEVHLHPRAQAELGSFLSRIASTNRRIVVETHSDYLIDRVGLAIRSGTISAENVRIVYFERRHEGGVVASEIRLDDSGNLLSAPTSYRRFFLDEQERVLG